MSTIRQFAAVVARASSEARRNRSKNETEAKRSGGRESASSRRRGAQRGDPERSADDDRCRQRPTCSGAQRSRRTCIAECLGHTSARFGERRNRRGLRIDFWRHCAPAHLSRSHDTVVL